MRPSDGGGPPPYGEAPEDHPDHGVPHAPAGGFSVEAKDLIGASHTWDDVSSSLKKVLSLCQPGEGYVGIFGMADTLYTTGQFRTDFNHSICQAAFDGSYITSYIADGLVETANDFSHTDTDQAANFRTYTNEVSDG
ncbi:hypothetical protein [Nocardioides mangrovi]|uniref:Uncharacterized protein n=1 Tax=Nocardioides mangrovi TaxID=2874580 RepID=A0ABS7U9F9_9ACTN|nr:hypothetical protein [Nocardioides mangrovi]MBZ5737489.1 hypothetical protein [Nocardioides mangrovi]